MIAEALIAAGVAAAALLVGPRAAARSVGELRSLVPLGARAWWLSGAALVALALAARFHVDERVFLARAAATAVGFAALYALARRFGAIADAAWNATLQIGWPTVAAATAIGALLVSRFVLGEFPHVSDEIAYEFQARSIAGGHWWLPAPPFADRFELPHVLVQAGPTGDARWYGIFPPGWPVLLAAGFRAGAPWLVNPLLAAGTVALFARFLRRTGLDPIEQKIALAAMVLAPCFVVLAGTSMSHTASLFFLVALLWGASSLEQTGQWRHALVVAAALAAGLLVRGFDFVAAGAPIALWFTMKVVRRARRPREIAALAALAIGGMAAVGATLLYQGELSGDPFEVPAVRYFEAAGNGRFGIGFGSDMGTSDHGAEWPGYWPSDVPRVTGYRLIEWCADLGNLPFGLLLLACATLASLRGERRTWVRLAWASGACVVAAYALHFYHGIAYGARHYFLALPAFAIAVAAAIGAMARATPNAPRAAAIRALWLALVAHALLFGLAPRLHEFSGRYRGVSGELRDAVAVKGLDRAIVFVVEKEWGFKFAGPLNGVPLARQPVIFARDRGDRNADLEALFPGRESWSIEVPRRGQPFEWKRLR